MDLTGSGTVSAFEERLISLLNSRKHSLVHLTHNDFDAVGGDAIHRMRFGPVTSIFCSVGSFPQALDAVAAVAGNDIVLSISDLGYQPGIEKKIQKVKEAGWQIEWRDHHRWSDEDRALVEGCCSILRIDTSTCACGICARDLLPDNPVAQEVARVVCDYDLWRHEDPRSAVLGVVLQRWKNRDYVRDRLAEGVFTDARIEEEYKDIITDMGAKMEKSIRKAVIRGTRFRIAFAPLFGYPSETAARMREELSTDIEVLISREGRFSLRSVPPISHLVAREYGGGGHPNAAGGNFDFSFWDRIRFRIFGTVPEFSRFVEITESI